MDQVLPVPETSKLSRKRVVIIGKNRKVKYWPLPWHGEKSGIEMYSLGIKLKGIPVGKIGETISLDFR